MPELTVTDIAIIAAAVIVGIVLGWTVRGSRASSEKAAISDGWHEQLDAQRVEHQRLLEQNKSLMEQNSQYLASNKDAKMRASELSGALKEAFERRDELQRQLKDIRGNLEKAVSERDQLLSGANDKEDNASKLQDKLKRREARIAGLKAELKSWQDRLPPLLEKYRDRDEAARLLEEQLSAARLRISALETMVGSEQTRVEPVDAAALGDAIDASNETIAEYVDEIATGHDEDLLDADALVDEFDGPDDTGEPFAARAAEDAFATQADLAPRDNLKLIKGVGPAIEKTLNELGIRRFEQIAAMSEYDINRVANRLKGFRSRIYREDWIGQARELRDRKAGGH